MSTSTQDEIHKKIDDLKLSATDTALLKRIYDGGPKTQSGHGANGETDSLNRLIAAGYVRKNESFLSDTTYEIILSSLN